MVTFFIAIIFFTAFQYQILKPTSFEVSGTVINPSLLHTVSVGFIIQSIKILCTGQYPIETGSIGGKRVSAATFIKWVESK